MAVFVRVLNILLMVGIPVLLAVFLVRTFRSGWKLIFAGALAFIASQVAHIPFNQFLLMPWLDRAGFTPTAGLPLLVFALAAGLSAGLFEEITRWLVLRFALKSRRSWEDGLLFGAGHGGVESVLVGFLALAGLINVAVYSSPEALASLPPDQVETARASIEAYWAVPWATALTGALERVFAICFHLSAAVLVMQVFLRHNRAWLLAAIAWHTLLDAAAVFLFISSGVAATETAAGVLALLSLALIFFLRPRPGDSGLKPLPREKTPPAQVDIPLNDPREQDKIDRSRYL